MASKRTLSPFLDKLMAYLAVEPGEWPGDPDALPYIKELVGLEHDYKIQWGTAGDAADALELQVRRRRDELIQIICRNYPDTANKLLLHDSVSSKADANDSATGTTTTHLERGQRCAQIVNEVKEFKYLRVDRGKPVSEIQLEKPNFLVWTVRENLAEDDRDLFDHPNRWGSVVTYAYGLLGREYNRSWTTIRDWVKEWNRSQKTTKREGRRR